jgi:hypothetical protein
MDTDGHEFEFSFDGQGHPGARAEAADPLRRALGDQVVTEDGFARIVAASKAIPRRASAAEVRHALALLATIKADQMQQTGDAGMPRRRRRGRQRLPVRRRREGRVAAPAGGMAMPVHHGNERLPCRTRARPVGPRPPKNGPPLGRVQVITARGCLAI